MHAEINATWSALNSFEAISDNMTGTRNYPRTEECNEIALDEIALDIVFVTFLGLGKGGFVIFFGHLQLGEPICDHWAEMGLVDYRRTID